MPQAAAEHRPHAEFFLASVYALKPGGVARVLGQLVANDWGGRIEFQFDDSIDCLRIVSPASSRPKIEFYFEHLIESMVAELLSEDPDAIVDDYEYLKEEFCSRFIGPGAAEQLEGLVLPPHPATKQPQPTDSPASPPGDSLDDQPTAVVWSRLEKIPSTLLARNFLTAQQCKEIEHLTGVKVNKDFSGRIIYLSAIPPSSIDPALRKLDCWLEYKLLPKVNLSREIDIDGHPHLVDSRYVANARAPTLRTILLDRQLGTSAYKLLFEQGVILLGCRTRKNEGGANVFTYFGAAPKVPNAPDTAKNPQRSQGIFQLGRLSLKTSARETAPPPKVDIPSEDGQPEFYRNLETSPATHSCTDIVVEYATTRELEAEQATGVSKRAKKAEDIKETTIKGWIEGLPSNAHAHESSSVAASPDKSSPRYSNLTSWTHSGENLRAGDTKGDQLHNKFLPLLGPGQAGSGSQDIKAGLGMPCVASETKSAHFSSAANGSVLLPSEELATAFDPTVNEEKEEMAQLRRLPATSLGLGGAEGPSLSDAPIQALLEVQFHTIQDAERIDAHPITAAAQSAEEWQRSYKQPRSTRQRQHQFEQDDSLGLTIRGPTPARATSSASENDRAARLLSSNPFGILEVPDCLEVDDPECHETMGQSAAATDPGHKDKSKPETADGRPTEPRRLVSSLDDKLDRLLTPLQFIHGNISLRAEFGRALLTGLDESALCYNPEGAQCKAWALDQLLKRLRLECRGRDNGIFTKILSTSAEDADVLIDSWTPVSANEQQEQIFYEFYCCRSYQDAEGKSHEDRFIVVVDGSEDNAFSVSMRAEVDELAPIYIHSIQRTWDSRICASYNDTGRLKSRYGTFAQALLDSMAVGDAVRESPLFSYQVDNSFGVEVDDVRFRRVLRFVKDKVYLNIHTVWRMAAVEVPERDGKGVPGAFGSISRYRGTAMANTDAIQEAEEGYPDRWIEASVSSMVAEAAFKENETLEFASRTSWTPEALKAAGAYTALYETTRQMIRRMDDVGQTNNNHQAGKHQLPRKTKPGHTVPGASYV